MLSTLARMPRAPAEYAAGAEAALERVLVLQPEHARSYLALGMLSGPQGRVIEAVQYCERALQLQPGWDEAQRLLQFARRKLHQAHREL